MQGKEIKRLTETSTKIYNNIQQCSKEDLDFLEELFKKKQIEYGKIRNFNLEDSKQIVTLTVKQNAMILLKYLVTNNVPLSTGLLDAAIDLLFAVQSDTKDAVALFEKQRIEREIFYLIVDVCYITKYVNEKLKKYVREKTMPDEVSANFTLLIDGTFKSYELSLLNSLKIDGVLVNFIESYKNKFRKIVKETIIDEITKKAVSANMKEIYRIFFLINDRSKKEYFEMEQVHCDEFIGFVASLIRDEKGADFALEKLQGYFDKLEEALKQFVYFAKQEKMKIREQDENTFCYILMAIERISKYKRSYFYKFLGLFQEILLYRVGGKLKGVIYEILTTYLSDKDVFIKKQLECQDAIEDEFKKHEFHLLPRVIRFINEYQKRKEYEEMLVNTGKSIGSPYLSVDETATDFKMWGFKSEDPLSVIECFDGKLDYETIKLNCPHLRNTILKNSNVVEKLIEYQINNNMIIHDTSIINLILCNSSRHFFVYLRLFDDFSYYINIDILDRISENVTEGLSWLNDCYTKEIGQFVINNCNFFNSLLKNSPFLQKRILKIYNKLVDDFCDILEIKAVDLETVDENDVLIEQLIVSQNDEFVTRDFFVIFAKQLVYDSFYKCIKPVDTNKLLGQYKSNDYVDYVKAKIAAGCDVANDITFLRQNLINVDDLVGFYNITSNSYTEPRKSTSILGNFGKKETAFFIRHFENATEFERFILFFGISKMNSTVENMIKNEIMNNLKRNNAVYLDMCVLQLFRCTDLDNLLVVLEKNYHNQKLLARLALVNLANGGKYFSKEMLGNLPKESVSKALFFVYFNGVWEKDAVLETASKMDCVNNNELAMIVEDYKKHI